MIPAEGSATVLRPARPSDAPEIARLSGDLGYEATPESAARRLARILDDPAHHVIVAELGGEVVGLASLLRAWTIHRDEVSVRLSTLVVDRGHRRRGIGERLVAAAEDWARARGARSLHLTSGNHRPDAHRFYARLGYSGDGMRFRKDL